VDARPAGRPRFLASAPSILAEARVTDPHTAVIDAEPSPALSVPAAALAEVAAAFADIPDLKSPYLHGHSSGVAMWAGRAADRLGLAPQSIDRLRVAALLHDLGRVGISDAVWDSPGPLSGPQWEQVRLHAYHSERVLARSRTLEATAEIAGRHHERLDGSGYHRGSKARELPIETRILAVADVYQALTQARPHREALGPDDAAQRVRDEVRDGRLDADAAAAVLEAAGQGRVRLRTTPPAGLTEREIVVLGRSPRARQPRDRRPPLDLAAHRRAPRSAHLRQARVLEPRGCRPVRDGHDLLD
jgi:HD-GYP domain-containing protein (c-di-GMP phosphodiesterase class II)